ncbi:MAG TPA: MaoC family dehydratase N-terminal domain-containing protein [Actinomycetota bacterium]|nr:MaoC family dehydratase N-terminal domain-containing protein [Actinomycetota bacterium]
MNPSAAGKAYPDATFTVDPAAVRAFRSVFDGASGVPPTFVTSAEFAVLPTIVADPELDLEFSRVLHGGQEYAYRRPLEIGETLTIRTRLETIREMAGNRFLTILTELVGADGEVACTARSTMIERGNA